jgi:hypothetical protein
MRAQVIFSALVLASPMVFADDPELDRTMSVKRCNQGNPDCGADLLRNGWQELARCDDGHEWGYVLEKDNERKFCSGINAFAGPEESPCVPFIQDLQEYKALAWEVKKERLKNYFLGTSYSKNMLHCVYGFDPGASKEK